MELDAIRLQINHIDEQLEDLLQQRLGLIKEVANIKKKNNLPIFDKKREDKILKDMKKRINPQFDIYVEKMFKAMFDISKSYQEKLINL